MELKGILHCHSTYSYDAKLSLSELKVLFLKSDIRFVCMTEHVDTMTEQSAHEFVSECEALSDDSFLFIPGFEVPYKHAHILMIGLRDFFGNYAPTIENLKKWTEKTKFVILAHPVRNHFDVDGGLLGEINALEVWNQQYEGKRVPRIRSLTLLQKLRLKKPALLATGGVDLHRREHLGAPFVRVSVNSLSELEIIEKLKEGEYTVFSAHTSFTGICTDPKTLKENHRFESAISVAIIIFGKLVNKALATCNISLPKSLKQLVRRYI